MGGAQYGAESPISEFEAANKAEVRDVVATQYAVWVTNGSRLDEAPK